MFFGSDEQRRAHKAWLASLKPGDEVHATVYRRLWNPREYTAKVVRRTKTRIVITSDRGGVEVQVNASDGGGYGWDGEIRALTQADHDKRERAALWARISEWMGDTSRASIDTLRAIVAAMDAKEGE